MRIAGASILLAAACASPAQAQESEVAAAALFDRVAAQPARLRVFLQAMPKGADLHHHLGGTPYAEDFIVWAGEADMCVSRLRLTFVPPPCTAPDLEPARDIGRRDEALYGKLIDTMSVRGRSQGLAVNDMTGHQDFFSSFGHFGPIGAAMPGAMLAATRRSAAANGVSYVETMPHPQAIPAAASLLQGETWDTDDMAGALDRIAPALDRLTRRATAEIDATEADARRRLGCDAAPDSPPCKVTVRYLGFGFRSLPPAAAFGQFALAFALAQNDPRFVGVNIVAPEDGAVAVADFDLHMRMLAFLRTRHPKVKLSLHAGELDLGLVPPAALSHHIRASIEVAGASRIGHGVSIAYEYDAAGLLADMAARRVPVEINLSSNDVILGVKGARHPLALYRAAGVPFVLSTDDEGVARSDLSNEYLRAVTEQGLRYADLKTAARSSLEYAFLPGAGIWQGGRIGVPVESCRDIASRRCADFAAASDKARLQLQLERELAAFETGIVTKKF